MRVAGYITWLAVAFVPVAACAADVPDVVISAVASGAAQRTGFAAREGHVLPETVYLKGDLARLEFRDHGELDYVLRDTRSDKGWLINERQQAALPLKGGTMARRYVYPIDRPCGDFGGTCDKGDSSAVAGRAATAWNFRHAEGKGPDGADSGKMWVDDATGLLLGYDAQDLGGRSLKWTVTSVEFGPLPPNLFELPKRPGR